MRRPLEHTAQQDIRYISQSLALKSLDRYDIKTHIPFSDAVGLMDSPYPDIRSGALNWFVPRLSDWRIEGADGKSVLVWNQVEESRRRQLARELGDKLISLSDARRGLTKEVNLPINDSSVRIQAAVGFSRLAKKVTNPDSSMSGSAEFRFLDHMYESYAEETHPEVRAVKLREFISCARNRHVRENSRMFEMVLQHIYGVESLDVLWNAMLDEFMESDIHPEATLQLIYDVVTSNDRDLFELKRDKRFTLQQMQLIVAKSYERLGEFSGDLARKRAMELAWLWMNSVSKDTIGAHSLTNQAVKGLFLKPAQEVTVFQVKR